MRSMVLKTHLKFAPMGPLPAPLPPCRQPRALRAPCSPLLSANVLVSLSTAHVGCTTRLPSPLRTDQQVTAVHH